METALVRAEVLRSRGNPAGRDWRYTSSGEQKGLALFFCGKGWRKSLVSKPKWKPKSRGKVIWFI